MQIPTGGVAFFDSGIGGLTVLAECIKYLPDEIFYYFGDNERAPYGNLPPEKILSYVEEAFLVFSSLKVRAAVLACNTATAVCAEILREKYPFPIVGAEPAVLPAAKRGGEIFVLSTCATWQSARFQALCKRASRRFPNAVITPVPCPTLAGEIEKRVFAADFSLDNFLPRGNPAAVVLGCTHYIYIKRRIEKFYNCPVYDGNEGIAKRLFSLLDGDAQPPFLENIRDGRPLMTTRRPPKIYYLGAQKMQNQRIFEQMFVK